MSSVSGVDEFWSFGKACMWLAEFSDQAEKKLQTALARGKLSATGLRRDGVRMDIDRREWIDIDLTYDLSEEFGLLHRAHSSSGEIYTDIALLESEVLKLWPAKQVKRILAESAAPIARRKRGRTGDKTVRIAEAMKKMPREELANMKGEAMAETFQAARSTCEKAREMVLISNVEAT